MLKQDIRVLIVDDSTSMRMVIKNRLAAIGIKNIVEAKDGAMAWACIEGALAKSQPFDIVLSDWQMPQMTGQELLQKVRGTPATKSLPFVMITAESKDKNISDANQYGVNGYLTKPFTPEGLQNVLAKAIESMRAA